MLRSLLTALTVSVTTILLAPTAGIAALLGAGERVSQWCMHTWARAACFAAGVTIEVHGREFIQKDEGTVYVANHVSWFDVFSVAAVLPRYTFIAKAELRRIPIFGWGAESAGVVFLERENRKSAFDSYRGAAAEVAKGVSIVVCPEGTRGTDYHLRPFKKGPFVLAIAAKARIVPCVVYGALEVMPKGSFRVTPNTVHIHLLEPIDAGRYDYENRHELMRLVWTRMADCMREHYGVGTHEYPIAPSIERSA